MKKKVRNDSFEFDVQEWFNELDKFNAVEPFVCEREQSTYREHVPFDDEEGSQKSSS